MPHIGEEIRRRREELGLTGTQLAAKAAMAPSAVSQIETGKRAPHSASLIKLADALGVEVGELYPKKAQPLLPEAPAPSERQRAFAERLMAAGVSEAVARGLAGLDYRPEEYWAALSKATGLDEASERVKREREALARLEHAADTLESWLAQLTPDVLILSKERLATLLRAVEQRELTAAEVLQEVTGVRT